MEADDEEFDSLNQSDSVNQSDHGNHEPQSSVNATNQPRLSTPTGDNPHEVFFFSLFNLTNKNHKNYNICTCKIIIFSKF